MLKAVLFCWISLMASMAINDGILGKYFYCGKGAYMKIKCTNVTVDKGTPVMWQKWDTFIQQGPWINVSFANEANLLLMEGRRFGCYFYAGKIEYWQVFDPDCSKTPPGTNTRDSPITEAPKEDTTTTTQPKTTNKEPSHNGENSTKDGDGKQPSSTDKDSNGDGGQSATIQSSLSRIAVLLIIANLLCV